MIAVDVNVLVNAFRDDATHHDACRNWLHATLRSGEVLALSNVVLSSFVRVVTHPKIFELPSPLEDALAFVEDLRAAENVAHLSIGPLHWDLFADLCRRTNARANLITDAFLAALAIEASCEWVSTDGDFSLFPGLRWRNPLTQRSE